MPTEMKRRRRSHSEESQKSEYMAQRQKTRLIQEDDTSENLANKKSFSTDDSDSVSSSRGSEIRTRSPSKSG